MTRNLLVVLTLGSSVLGASLLGACSHQTEFYGGHIDIGADEEFQRELGRRDVDVKQCYASVSAKNEIPLEMVVDDNGKPLAARATGPLFGSTLAGCLETVAFRITLPPGGGRRIAHATAGPHPIPAAQVSAQYENLDKLPSSQGGLGTPPPSAR